MDPNGDGTRGLRAQLHALGDAERRLAAVRHSGDLLPALLRQARALIASEAAYLFRLEDDGLHLACAENDAVEPMALASLAIEPLPLSGTSCAAEVARSGTPVDAAEAGDLAAFDGKLDEALGFTTGALLCVPITASWRTPGQSLGVLQLARSPANGAFPAGSLELLGTLAQQAGLALEHLRDLDALQQERLEILWTLAAAAESDDTEAPLHVRRVSAYSVIIGEAIGLDPATIQQLRLASPLHDVGKIGIPTEVLYKAGKLTDEEFELTKTHSARGAAMLEASASPLLKVAARIARSHHERWDGRGYPDGLTEEDIPLLARITTVADVFDALTTPRSYKKALGVDQSLKILVQEAGRHFDPDLVEAFQGSFAEILEAKRRCDHPASDSFKLR